MVIKKRKREEPNEKNVKKGNQHVTCSRHGLGSCYSAAVLGAETDLSKQLIAHYDFEDAQGTKVPNV